MSVRYALWQIYFPSGLSPSWSRYQSCSSIASRATWPLAPPFERYLAGIIDRE